MLTEVGFFSGEAADSFCKLLCVNPALNLKLIVAPQKLASQSQIKSQI